jgi:hypothetical protein
MNAVPLPSEEEQETVRPSRESKREGAWQFESNFNGGGRGDPIVSLSNIDGFLLLRLRRIFILLDTFTVDPSAGFRNAET